MLGAHTVSTSPSGRARDAEFGMKLPDFVFNGGNKCTFLKKTGETNCGCPPNRGIQVVVSLAE